MQAQQQARPGGMVVVRGHTTCEAARTGVILEVLGGPDHVHYRVRWDEEHESLYWPGTDASIRPGRRRAHCATRRGTAES